MTNPLKGDHAIRIGGRDYTLRYSVNACCELEDAAGRCIGEIVASLDDGDRMSVKLMRQVFWAGLIEHHGVSHKEAGDLMSEAGFEAAAQAIGAAFAKAFPQAEAGDAKADPKNGAATG